ncbi:MerR family transcriptional regulator [Amycolatopsis sp. NPDC051071]|uniref:MerR family transcriptional regulator n=1 Tax=Amycolatopsis sp. NPDC051071 TaxID=3154637 RepID=UPI0034212862
MKPVSSRPAGYTIEELSAVAGMSARNIRAHQTRGLLPPPMRHGRSAYYGQVHLRRLERITLLQKQGFNLASIAATLGTVTSDRETGRLDEAMADIARDQPLLFGSLERHGLLGRDEAGAVTIARPAVSRAVSELAGAGIPPAVALRLLGRFMDRVSPVAETLVGVSAEQLAADGGSSAAQTACLAEVLVSAFRTAVENAVELTFPGSDRAAWAR